jgi:hypothetical protein
MHHGSKAKRAGAKSLGFVLAVVGFLSLAKSARAEAPASSPPYGLIVLAEGDAVLPAKSLAHSVYGDPGLLPRGLDESRARVLAGEPVPADASGALRDLAETRAAVHGDDAPTRSLLSTLSSSFHVKGIVVVLDHAGSRGGAGARVFVAATGAFDAVLYEADVSPSVTWGVAAPALTWAGASNALHRSFADVVVVAPVETRPPAPIVGEVPPLKDGKGEKPSGGRPFYTSPWFWGAIGAAAFAGAAFFFASRDSSDPAIQLQVQVPK